MKRILFSLVLASVFFSAPAQAKWIAVNEMTGLEWLKCSVEKRQEGLDQAMGLLRKHGIRLAQSKETYYAALNEMLRMKPETVKQPLADSLATVVHETEPGNREAVEAFRKTDHSTRKVRTSWT